MNFKDELSMRTEFSESVIKKYLLMPGKFDSEIIEAMNYSIEVGGKRLRPILINSFYKLFNGDKQLEEPCMAAMEMLHTYSLVHDDMPAIDNDSMRRGMPTSHVKFGEAKALLAGDGLLHLAYETFIKVFDKEISDNTIKALQIFGDCTGINGMFGGQAADVIHTGEVIEDDLLYYIYYKKTGALIRGSMMIGAILAGASDTDLEKIKRIGNEIGLAFQIRDDILDIEGDEAVIGKPLHSDDKNQKKTYVTVNGIEKSEQDIEDLSKSAIELLNEIGCDSQERSFLNSLFSYLSDRKK